jgi:hypothetical protein
LDVEPFPIESLLIESFDIESLDIAPLAWANAEPPLTSKAAATAAIAMRFMATPEVLLVGPSRYIAVARRRPV